MKYIRTKEEMDKIHEVAWINCGYIGFLDTKNGCDISHIYKQADNIAELCDEFVGIRKSNHKARTGKLVGSHWFEETGGWIGRLDSYESIYGAIWTDKGLIYVAKMNEKGELELL